MLSLKEESTVLRAAFPELSETNRIRW